MRRTQTVCDVDETVKKDTNHWWRVSQSHGTLTITPFDAYGAGTGIGQNVCVGSAPVVKDCCGEKCVSVLVSRFMQTGTIEPPATVGGRAAT